MFTEVCCGSAHLHGGAGSQDTVKKALCGKGHERLMRVAEVLAGDPVVLPD